LAGEEMALAGFEGKPNGANASLTAFSTG